jgi:RimJ/RimL family protein N-acetyltransferase
MLDQVRGCVKIGLMIQITPLTARHVADLVTLAADDPDRPWPTSPGRAPLGSAQAFVVHAQRLRARDAGVTFAVCDGDRLVGIVTLVRDAAAPDRAELGYWIGRDDRGRGHASAAVRQVVGHGFGRMGLDLVFAHCPDANLASGRVLAKLGFRRVASSGDPRRFELGRQPPAL